MSPYWYYDKKELRRTPSIGDEIDHTTELRYRKDGARFIMELGGKLELGCNTMATGVVFFHRFYMFHSFRSFPRYPMACCCLFLAGKVEETPKKCKDIIRVAKQLLSAAKLATFGENLREEILSLEKILMQTIKFDFQVEHPYNFIVTYAKRLKGNKVKLQKMVQMAWTFVNDSLCTTLCLQWEPEILAIALIYLAGKLSRFEFVDWHGRKADHLRWWDMFVEDVRLDLLEDICHQVLDLYTQPSTEIVPDSPPLSTPSPPSPKSTTNKSDKFKKLKSKSNGDNSSSISEAAVPSTSTCDTTFIPGSYPYQTYTAYLPHFPTTHMSAPLGPSHLGGSSSTAPVYIYTAPQMLPSHYSSGMPTSAAYYSAPNMMTQLVPPPPPPPPPPLPPSHRKRYSR